MGCEWRLEYVARPQLLNSERSAHWRAHRATTEEWRQAFRVLALEAKIPRCEQIEVTVIHERKDRRSIPDVGACFPSVKAAVDGVTDAGVVDHDGPDHVVRLVFEAPVVTGRHALVLVVREVD